MEHAQKLRRGRSIGIQHRLDAIHHGRKIGMSGEFAPEFIQENSSDNRPA